MFPFDSSKTGGTGGRTVFSFAALPQNIAQLQAMPESALTTPFQTAALTVAVLCRYADSVTETIDMLNFLKGPQPLSTYETQFLRDRLAGKSYIPRSFFAGSTPQNNYTPTLPYTITVLEDPYTYAQEGYAKLLIQSSGADQARPIKLRKKGAQWFLWDNFLLSDIRRPATEDPWA